MRDWLHPAGQAPARQHGAPHEDGQGGLYPEHRKFADDGFVALIECDPERSALATNAERLKPEHAYRTGHVAHLRREVFAKLFDVPLESCQDCVFVEVGLIDQLESVLKREAT